MTLRVDLLWRPISVWGKKRDEFDPEIRHHFGRRRIFRLDRVFAGGRMIAWNNCSGVAPTRMGSSYFESVDTFFYFAIRLLDCSRLSLI